MGSDRLLVLTDDDFDERIRQGDAPVLVDFWASWCAPCKQVVPTLEALAEELDGRVRVAKVNIDENDKLASRFGIRSIPTLVLFREGKVLDQVVGAAPKDTLRAMIDKHLGVD